ncbi:hypothetical protein AAMO2058_000141100 [Amorphochlora amoebiformis]
MDKDTKRVALYRHMPSCMKMPWRQDLAEIRVIDVPCKNKHAFLKYLKKREIIIITMTAMIEIIIIIITTTAMIEIIIIIITTTAMIEIIIIIIITTTAMIEIIIIIITTTAMIEIIIIITTTDMIEIIIIITTTAMIEIIAIIITTTAMIEIIIIIITTTDMIEMMMINITTTAMIEMMITTNYSGPGLRFIDPSISASSKVRLTQRRQSDIMTYLLNYIRRDGTYNELTRNCQDFAADLYGFLAGVPPEQSKPYHAVCRLTYKQRRHLFLYDP